MNVIVTMAGIGKRFRDAGYSVPKYQVEVRGRTLFAWSMESLLDFMRQDAKFIFVMLRRDDARAFLLDQCRMLGIRNVAVVEIEEMTDGQASTALLASPHVDRGSGVVIYNIDTYVDPAQIRVADIRGDGWIPCFPGVGTGWSFARAEADGRIVEVREKQRISSDATVGLYWFSSFALYEQTYHTYYASVERLEMGERYIAPIYNQLIQDGRPVYLHRILAKAVVPLGTPAEVDAFRDGKDRGI